MRRGRFPLARRACWQVMVASSAASKVIGVQGGLRDGRAGSSYSEARFCVRTGRSKRRSVFLGMSSCFVPPLLRTPPCFAAVLASVVGGLAWALRFGAARRLTKCALPWRMPLTAEAGLGNPCHDAETAGFCQKRAGLAIAESGRCRIPGMTMGLRKRFPRWRFVRINIARQYGLLNRLLFDHSGARRVLEPRGAEAE